MKKIILYAVLVVFLTISSTLVVKADQGSDKDFSTETCTKIADFQSGSDPLNSGGSSYVKTGSKGSKVTGKYSAAHDHTVGKGFSYKLNYQVVQGSLVKAFFESVPQTKNWSPFEDLSLWIKGAVGGETIYVEIKDNEGKISNVEGPFTAPAPTDPWQHVLIALSKFRGVNLFSMNSVIVVVSDPGKGTLFIDDIGLCLQPKGGLASDKSEDQGLSKRETGVSSERTSRSVDHRVAQEKSVPKEKYVLDQSENRGYRPYVCTGFTNTTLRGSSVNTLDTEYRIGLTNGSQTFGVVETMQNVRTIINNDLTRQGSINELGAFFGEKIGPFWLNLITGVTAESGEGFDGQRGMTPFISPEVMIAVITNTYITFAQTFQKTPGLEGSIGSPIGELPDLDRTTVGLMIMFPFGR